MITKRHLIDQLAAQIPNARGLLEAVLEIDNERDPEMLDEDTIHDAAAEFFQARENELTEKGEY